MNRYNHLTFIHKALRAMLYETALQLQQIDFSGTAGCRSLLNRIREIQFIFRKQAAYEMEYLFQPLGIKEAVDQIKKSNSDLMTRGDHLIHVVNISAQAVSQPDRIMAGSALAVSFRHFLSTAIGQMELEESLLSTVIWKKYSDPELRNIHRKIQDNYSAMEKEVIAFWMIRGLNKSELLQWLEEVRQTAPSYVYHAILELAEQELPTVYRDEVLEKLAREAVLA